LASDRPDPRIAAVLILSYPRNGEPCIVFTQRSETVSTHRGQISLPGGAREQRDASLEATALRETSEELGIDPADVRIVGRLDDEYVIVSNFLIAPIIGLLDHEPTFSPSKDEVAAVIEIPLERLRDPTIFREEDWWRPEMPRMQFYSVNGHEIWGATARIVRKFLASEYPDLLASADRPVSRPTAEGLEPTRG
jgi:8-oxo-dGTP pyrophosphatase MutT (NUDIX family)